jgi:hypothetical protein
MGQSEVIACSALKESYRHCRKMPKLGLCKALSVDSGAPSVKEKKTA